jgi:hypothetical protein
MSVLLEVGRLVSTSDEKLARKLQKLVRLDEITGGKTPEALRQSQSGISFMFAGSYYELERVAA